MPLSCLRSADSKSNSSIRLPLTTATRVSSRWRASISIRVVIMKSPRARRAQWQPSRAVNRMGGGAGRRSAGNNGKRAALSRSIGNGAGADPRHRDPTGKGRSVSGVDHMRHASVNLVGPGANGVAVPFLGSGPAPIGWERLIGAGVRCCASIIGTFAQQAENCRFRRQKNAEFCVNQWLKALRQLAASIPDPSIGGSPKRVWVRWLFAGPAAGRHGISPVSC